MKVCRHGKSASAPGHLDIHVQNEASEQHPRANTGRARSFVVRFTRLQWNLCRVLKRMGFGFKQLDVKVFFRSDWTRNERERTALDRPLACNNSQKETMQWLALAPNPESSCAIFGRKTWTIPYT